MSDADISRRGFLKILGVAGVVAAVPQFVLASPDEAIDAMPLELGRLRAMAQYRIAYDDFVVRLDAFNQRTKYQFHVEFSSGPDPVNNRDRYLKNREQATEVLENMIRQHQWNVRDMVALPIPDGIRNPAWL